MYNPLKKESHVKKFSKFWIEKVYENIQNYSRGYEVYVDNENDIAEIVYVISNDELKTKMYRVIQRIKNSGAVELKNVTIKIRKTVINPKEERLFAFYIDVYKENDQENSFNTKEVLIEMVEFANKLSSLNIGLIPYDNIKEEYGGCRYLGTDYLFEFITLFDVFDDITPIEIQKNNYGFLVDTVFFRITNGKASFNHIKEIGYYPYLEKDNFLDIVKLLYNYYDSNDTSTDIISVLEKESTSKKLVRVKDSFREFENLYVLPSVNLLDNKYKKLDLNDNYTDYVSSGYDMKIRIFKDPNEETLDCLIGISSIYELDKYLGFTLKGILCDTDSNFVGYIFENVEDDFSKIEKVSIDKLDFTDVKEIVETLFKVKTIFSHLRNTGYKKSYIDGNTIDVKNDISYYVLDGDINVICFKDIYSLYKAVSVPEEVLQNELAKLVLDWYSKYIISKYKIINRSELKKSEYYDFLEVKCLSADFAKELYKNIKYLSVNYDKAYFSFFVDYLSNISLSNQKLYYYSKNVYSPEKVEYIFDFQVLDKFNITIQKGEDIKLNDSRTIHFLKRSVDINTISDLITENEYKLSQMFGTDFVSDNIHFSGLNSLILSVKPNSNGGFSLIGFVEDAIFGSPLSKVDFSKFSNKDFIRLAKDLFVYFNNTSIDLDKIRMTDDFNFYISKMKNFKLYKTKSKYYAKDFQKKYADKIVGIEENIDFSDKEELEKLYNSLDSFCNEHGIYFSSSDKMCPICRKTLYDIESYNNYFGEVVFEDKYAKHYALNDKLNLKLYKEDNIDLKMVEKNIDMLMKRENDEYYCQTLFLPYKKAVFASTRKFVGYVYKKVDFSRCKNLSKDFKNITKIKSLISLSRQVLNLETKSLCFFINPYGSVLFIPDYKRQLQIVNIDFLVECNDKAKILISNGFCVKYIKRSLNNEIGIENLNSKLLKDIQIEMINLIGCMTKECKIHGIHYHKKYLVCPICMPNFDSSIIDKNSIRLSVDKFCDSATQKGEGGESVVYKYSEGIYAKIFKKGEDEDVNLELKLTILLKLLEKRNVLRRFYSKNSKFVYITPEKLIIDSNTNEVRGYTLKEVKGVPISELQYKENVEKMGLSVQDIFDILIAVGEGIEYLHKNANMYIGDLNGGNIFFDENKIVYFIDLDGMGIDDIHPVFFTAGYVDPIAERNETISMEDDWFSFAIHVFYYLIYVHPFGGIYSDENGKKLDEVGKMEKRISLVGRHGVEVPPIAKDWNFLGDELINVFIGIFEKDTKENITPYLKKYYNREFLNIHDEEKSVCTSFSKSKMVLKNITLFNGDYSKIINNISYIESSSNMLCVQTSSKIIRISWLNGAGVVDVKLSSNEKYIFIIYKDKISVIDSDSEISIYSKYDKIFNNNIKFVVSENTLYYAFEKGGEDVIVKVDFKSKQPYFVETFIKFKTNMKTLGFMVEDNQKFVVVKKDNDKDRIFCNDLDYLDIPNDDANTEYKVLFDSVSGRWLVINSNGFCVIIRSNGQNIILNDDKLRECNIDKVQFINGYIYTLCDGGIYIINTKASKNKFIECKVARKESNLIVKSRSFYIFDKVSAYEYTKN